MDTQNIEHSKREHFRMGAIILAILGIFTFGEYALSSFGVTLWFAFIIIALLKAFLVLRDYMHIGRLFTMEEQE